MIQIPDGLIKYAVAVTIGVAAVGQLPRFTHFVQIQTIKLLKNSQSSNWGKVWIPEESTVKTRKPGSEK
ncbi:MAG: hypothetical protein K2Q26_12175 [Bdellovibrionales bacterium]|nr:hypothetical protein [Bdellovibrionales bacterium]